MCVSCVSELSVEFRRIRLLIDNLIEKVNVRGESLGFGHVFSVSSNAICH